MEPPMVHERWSAFKSWMGRCTLGWVAPTREYLVQPDPLMPRDDPWHSCAAHMVSTRPTVLAATIDEVKDEFRRTVNNTRCSDNLWEQYDLYLENGSVASEQRDSVHLAYGGRLYLARKGKYQTVPAYMKEKFAEMVEEMVTKDYLNSTLGIPAGLTLIEALDQRYLKK
eukprot:TRINITY_DN104380_c0_g1_i1.p1 TRINITY_DN104380_c0_g1~~TRINITY_DN104380_c0_g1_i1.p1  ORF type:complete len:169 (-),score=7.53 TRINITY_DN104380_c0_g1_i1:15-521(-)